MQKIQNFIDGKLTPPLGGQYFDTIEPATGHAYAQVPDSDAADLDLAVAGAHRAFPAWRDTPLAQRAAMVHRLGDLVEARRAEFERAEAIDNGKPLYLTRTTDIARSIANLHNFGDSFLDTLTQTFEKPHATSYTLRQPIGIVSIISPWNLPLLLFTWKLAPALVAGNCVIAKPSEVTPMTAYLLSTLATEAGFPPGVFNVLHGTGARIGAAITKHPDIRAISFTGGTSTGLGLYEQGAKQFKKISLELGGKNATVVFADADFDKAVDGAVASAFTNQGQVCLCSERIFIEASIYEKFKAALVEKTKQIAIGDPLDEATRYAATVSKPHMEKILEYIELAKEEGGTLLTGGKRHILPGRCKDGYFIEPTLFENLPNSCRTNQEEVFGPFATLIPFSSEEEVLGLVNDTPYGLASCVFTESKERAARVAARIDTGIVWINCWNVRDLDTPFGGMKKSGLGREGKQRALEFFTEEKTVTRLK